MNKQDGKRNQRTRWTKEEVRLLALGFNSISAFKRAHGGAYEHARKNAYLFEINQVMESGNETWTYEKIRQCALKCETRKEFIEQFNGAYRAANRLDILTDVTSHMGAPQTALKWTEERSAVEAKKYFTRTEFKRENQTCYERARKGGYLDRICAHMLSKAEADALREKNKSAMDAIKDEENSDKNDE